MNNIDLDDRDGTLELAMISAISLIAAMDESLNEGCATIAPDEIVQTLEKSAPLLLSEVA